MTSFKTIFARFCVALLLTANFSDAAQLELPSAEAVRIHIGAGYQRVAVDVSRDLLSWRAMTNVAPTAGQITFANNPEQSDPARFFRISNADDTVAISGYVDAGERFGGIAGATIRESLTGTTAQTDANGFFHFNQRFARADLPLKITAYSDDRDPVERTIHPSDANTFSAFRMQMSQPTSLSAVEENQTYYFKVTSGARAGLEYSLHFAGGRATLTGAVSGQSLFQQISVDSVVRYSLALGQKSSEIVFGPNIARGDDRIAFFAGIPSTNGTLSGNGIVTWHLTNFAPAALDGLAFQIGNAQIQFTNGFYRLLHNNVVDEGTYAASKNRSVWTVNLTRSGQPVYIRALDLMFSSFTTGTFQLTSAGQAPVTGEMQQIPFIVLVPTPGIEPASVPPKLSLTVTSSGGGGGFEFAVYFSGGTSGTFIAFNPEGNSMGSGTFVYTPMGNDTAHLRLTYPDTGNEWDDITLHFQAQPGSTTPSTFTGTQLIGSTVYPFTGTFTY